jgi:hypothetical protein
LLRYWAIPRIAVWRTRRLAPVESDEDERFEVLLPDPTWMNSSVTDLYEEDGREAR